MKSDLIIIIDTKTSMVYKNQNILGVNYENKQSKIIYNFNNGFPDGTAWLEVVKPSGTKGYIQMTKVGETYELLILSSLLNEVGKLNFQLRITQGTDPNDPPVFKSNDFNLTVKEALNTTTEIPEEYPSWIDIADAKLNEVDNLDINVSKSGTIAKVEITKKDGLTKEVEILDGEKGEKGDDYVITEQDYQNIADIVKDDINIPTKVSDLTNDLGFVTDTVNNLVNYYTKTQTYTKSEVNDLIGQISTSSFEIVEELPETGQTNVIYLVLREEVEINNIYDEFIYVSNSWEKIGSTDIDLTGYATETWVNTQLGDYYTKTEIGDLLLKNIRDGEGDLSVEENQDSIAIGKWSHAEGRGQSFEVEITNVDSTNSQITVNDTDGLIRKNALLWIPDDNEDGAYYYVVSKSGTAPTITLTLDSNSREIKDGTGTVTRTHYLSNVTTGTTIKVYMGVAGGSASHIEGVFNNTAWLNSDTEKNEVNVQRNHAEGSRTLATGYTAHAEGEYTQALGNSSHAEGSNTIAQGHFSHAEGNTTQAIGDNSHATGENTIAGYDNQAVFGRYNKNSADSMFEVGNGTSSKRKNVFSVNKDGSLVINDEYPFEMTDITPERVLDSRVHGGLYRVGFKYNLGDGNSEYGEVLTIPYIGSSPNYNPYSAQIFFPNGDSSNNKNNFWIRTCQGKSNGNPNWNAWVKVTPKDYMTDVQINSTSIKSNGVANIPYAGTNNTSQGLVWAQISRGIEITNDGEMKIQRASDADILAKSSDYYPITPSGLDYATKIGLTTNTLTLSDAEKASAQSWLGVNSWRKIYDRTLTEAEGGVDIDHDLDNNTFQITDFRCTVYIPADAGNTNSGYLRFKGDAELSWGALYGSTNYGTTSQNCLNIYEGHIHNDQPFFMEFTENMAQATASRTNIMRSMSNKVNYYTYLSGIQLYRNAGNFPIGTRIVVYAIYK